jgi:hypothetical protein
MTVDEYVWENLPRTCQWIALRHIVFEGLLAGQSTVFGFEYTQSDPLGWHLEWMGFAGVQLPLAVVDGMARAAVDRSRRYINKHVGGKEASTNRTWEDEVGVDVVDGADEILRTFLPPVLLARWGVTG